MRTWTRARWPTRCGGPHGRPTRMIARGDPMLTITVIGVRRGLVRCADCAGEPVPELPPLEDDLQTAGDFTHVQRTRPTTTHEWMPYRDSE
jgi:hypothetical protein